MSNWIAVVQKVDNGYTVKFRDEEIATKKVYEVKDNSDETNRDHFLNMIYDLIEYFGEIGSKYDKRRIKICYEIGTGWNGKRKDAEKDIEFDVIN